jgi:cytochrome c553
MYFVIAYDIRPHLTGRALDSFRLMRLQLWTWFVGMIVLTFPWHYVGILGMPRRMAFYDYSDPTIAAQAASVIAVAAIVVEFAWLRLEQPGERFRSVWDAIFSAAGLVQAQPAGGQVVEADYPTTRVEVTPQPRRGISCGHLQTVGGLPDRRAPARSWPRWLPASATRPCVTSPYNYAYLPRVSGDHPAAGEPPQIVAGGAPMRGIAPCGACHGVLDSKAGAAWLGGQPAVYLRTQLQAFASGARRNDIGEQMRNIARRMTPEEIAAASRFYADHP